MRHAKKRWLSFLSMAFYPVYNQTFPMPIFFLCQVALVIVPVQNLLPHVQPKNSYTYCPLCNGTLVFSIVSFDLDPFPFAYNPLVDTTYPSFPPIPYSRKFNEYLVFPPYAACICPSCLRHTLNDQIHIVSLRLLSDFRLGIIYPRTHC